MDFDKKAADLFLDIPEAPKETGVVANAVQTGKLVFVSGAYPWKEGRLAYKGRLGIELTPDVGRMAANAACVQALGFLNGHLKNSLNKVKRIVSIKVNIAAGSDFKNHQKVADGASLLLNDVFGPLAGKHSRVVVGVNSLPMGAAVEVELIAEVK